MLNYQLAKLTIDSYQDKERQSKIDNFEVMFNPTSISFNRENKYSKLQPINTSALESSYQNTPPQTLALELIIDTTSFNNKTVSQDVKKKVEDFFKMFVMNGEIHQPPFLKIHWGEMNWGWNDNLAFDCRISLVKVTYNLFGRNATPLRATLNVEFIEDIANSKRIRIERKSSPDLTHTRVVTAGSNLPLFAQQIYQNPLLYLKIAQHNKLDNFRGITPGTVINFPPIVKSDIEKRA